MFFVFSKLLLFFVQPLAWIFGLFAAAFLSKNARRKRRLLRGGVGLLFLLTNPLFSNLVFRSYEWRPEPIAALRDTFDIAIVLGGFTNGGVDEAARDRLNFSPAANRLTDAVVLYKRGIIRKILISGGSGDLLIKEAAEADLTRPFLLDMGVRDTDILLENRSRNTHENAVLTKQLIDNQQLTEPKLLLITSAFHMPRAFACFQKVGLQPHPFAAHFLAEPLNWTPRKWLIPTVDCLLNWEGFIKEWVGCAVYKCQGYI